MFTKLALFVHSTLLAAGRSINWSITTRCNLQQICFTKHHQYRYRGRLEEWPLLPASYGGDNLYLPFYTERKRKTCLLHNSASSTETCWTGASSLTQLQKAVTNFVMCHAVIPITVQTDTENRQNSNKTRVRQQNFLHATDTKYIKYSWTVSGSCQ